MRVAVSGATGFVGRHVLSELARHSVKLSPLVGGFPPRVLLTLVSKRYNLISVPRLLVLLIVLAGQTSLFI